MRPTIGITIGYDDRGTGLHLRQDYVRAVEGAGGLPIVLPPGRPADAPEFLDRVQGLILSGGSDVDPGLYGEAPHPKLRDVVRERDDFELALTREAIRRNCPLLAICRGHQVLNVALGGTLIQDLPSVVAGDVEHDPSQERWERAHAIQILEGTRLRAILERGTVFVNSFHHQAVGRVGDGLVVSARSDGDRVIEAVELPGPPFVLGVQWHPEAFWNREDGFQALFAALVSTSRH